MVPASVINAWQQFAEKKKTEVCRLCAKQQPLIFERWREAAGLNSFRLESITKRKAGAAARLDEAFLNAEEGNLAADILISYFTAMMPEINNKYLEILDSCDNEDNETKLKIYAQLLNLYPDSPVIQLYLATALWIEEFAETDREKVSQIAADLLTE